MIKNGMNPVHPGEILQEEFLNPLGLSVNVLAEALQIPHSELHDIAMKRCGVSSDIAMRLAQYFITTPQFWLNLQLDYDQKFHEN